MTWVCRASSARYRIPTSVRTASDEANKSSARNGIGWVSRARSSNAAIRSASQSWSRVPSLHLFNTTGDAVCAQRDQTRIVWLLIVDVKLVEVVWRLMASDRNEYFVGTRHKRTLVGLTIAFDSFVEQQPSRCQPASIAAPVCSPAQPRCALHALLQGSLPGLPTAPARARPVRARGRPPPNPCRAVSDRSLSGLTRFAEMVAIGSSQLIAQLILAMPSPASTSFLSSVSMRRQSGVCGRCGRSHLSRPHRLQGEPLPEAACMQRQIGFCPRLPFAAISWASTRFSLAASILCARSFAACSAPYNAAGHARPIAP